MASLMKKLNRGARITIISTLVSGFIVYKLAYGNMLLLILHRRFKNKWWPGDCSDLS